MAAGSGESGWSPAFSLTLPDLRCLLRSEAEEADPLSKKTPHVTCQKHLSDAEAKRNVN